MQRSIITLILIAIALVGCSKPRDVTIKHKSYEITVTSVERVDRWSDPKGSGVTLDSDSDHIVIVLALSIKSPNHEVDIEGPFELRDSTGSKYESPLLSIGFIGAEQGRPSTFQRPLGFRVPRTKEVRTFVLGGMPLDVQGLLKPKA